MADRVLAVLVASAPASCASYIASRVNSQGEYSSADGRCAAGGAWVGARSGAMAGAFVGSAVGAANAIVRMADAGKGRGGNRVPNRLVRRIARDNQLNEEGRRALHDTIMNTTVRRKSEKSRRS